jgi:hypothetical protein
MECPTANLYQKSIVSLKAVLKNVCAYKDYTKRLPCILQHEIEIGKKWRNKYQFQNSPDCNDNM